MTEPTNEESSNPAGVCQIVINFPAGPNTTGISADLRFVDSTQIELAGRFLIRQANRMYFLAEQAQNQKNLIAPPQGFRVDA